MPLARLAVLCVVCLSLTACQKTEVPQGSPLLVGQPFPAFMLDFLARNNEGAPAWQGKLLVLNVWATWCPPCRREMPDLDLLSKTLDPKRFAVIGLSIDQDALLAKEFLLQHGITFSNFFDKGGELSGPLALKAYPETFLIAPDRTLLRRMTGLHAWASPEIVALIEGLHPARPGPAGEQADARH